MPQPPIDPALALFELGMLMLSVTACFQVLHMYRRGSVLPYEPRRPVPWGPIGCTLAVLLLLFVAISALGGDSREAISETPVKPHSSWGLINAMLAQLLIVVAFLFVVALFSKATLRDLGLPMNWRIFIRDVLIGAAACLAALAPVHLTQFLMLSLFFPKLTESGHPIIKMVMESPSSSVMFWTGVATVVMAPICEEITFRLLLQGWLERWEDEQLGWRQPAVVPLASEIESPGSTGLQVDALQSGPELAPALPAPDPPRRGIGGLPYGWFPILVSAVAFGIAHFGYGPEPVPIFLLGLVLGYVYQRTHRLIPSIVTHALFNLFTMFILWRMLYGHS
jgi:membrane protease YdiL (CAAX protease family)